MQGGEHDLIPLTDAGTGWETSSAANSDCPQPGSGGCKWVCRVRRLQGEGEPVFRPEERLPGIFNWEFGELLE